jgi:hypoxanthine phosphoribosyltransferase
MRVEGVDVLYDVGTIGERITRLGAEVREALADEDPILVSLLSGSVIFLADLVRAIEAPLRFEFIQVSYSSADGAEDDVLEIEYPLPVDIDGQSILLIKDVVASGIIESYLGQQLRQRGAQDVRFAALIDLPDERKTALSVDFSAFVERKAGAFVGYGLKHKGRYGNLPYIGRLSGEA